VSSRSKDDLIARFEKTTKDFSWEDLKGINLYGASLGGIHFRSALLESANFKYADLTGSNCRHAYMDKANLSYASLVDADLSDASLVGACLVECVLSKANLTGANLWRANLTRANLRASVLVSADLTNAYLSNADLSNADLTNANLSNADLTRANLSGANLTGANLTGANLTGTDLTDANLTDTILPQGYVVSKQDKVESKVEMKDQKSDSINGKDANNQLLLPAKDIRTYSAILPNALEIAKNLFRLGIRLGLKALGKTGEVIRSWIVIAEDFLDSHREIADNVFRWLLGWGSKNLHQLRKLPGVKDLEFLSFLENPEIQKFGMFVEANTEGVTLGDLAKKALEFLQQWIFGSTATIRIGEIGEALSDPGQLVRIFAEMSSSAKDALRREMEAETEAAEAEKKAKALARAEMAAA